MAKTKIEIELDEHWLRFIQRLGKAFDLTPKQVLEQELEDALHNAEVWFSRGQIVADTEIKL